MAEKKFIDGLSYKYPREGAPDFVKGSLSIKVNDFATWFATWRDANPDEAWINIDLLEGRSGKPYCALNEYKKSGMTERPAALQTQEAGSFAHPDIDPSDVPF